MKTDGRKTNNAAHLKKPVHKKKQPITIYESGEDISLLGGIDSARAMLKEYINNCINDRKVLKGLF